MKTPALIAVCLLGLASALSGALADGHTSAEQGRYPIVFSAAGGAKEVGAEFERFLAELGGVDNGNEPGPLKKGFRTVNWDAAAVPFDMPGDFFKNQVTRGMELVGTKEFRVSNPPRDDPGFPDNLFDSINKDHPNQFQAFSPERIFSPLKDNRFSILFSVPGLKENATVAGFGAIFVDVDVEFQTYLDFFGTAAQKLGRYFVPAYPQGLSFLGVVYKEPVVAKVGVQLGNAELPNTDLPPLYEVVAMDDFGFGEPQAIAQMRSTPKPSPTPAPMYGSGSTPAPGRREAAGYSYGR